MPNVAHNQGKRGEILAIAYLVEKGYTIITQNWRYKKAEVDIIAQLNDCLVFIEVKLRKSNSFGYPEQFVTKHKKELYLMAANEYINQTNWQHHIRFDIIAIETNEQLTHFEDAFY